jgi:hypothetical protein
MTNHERQVPAFQAASRRVVARLFAANWVRLLGRSAVVVFPAAMLLAVCLGYCGFPWINVFWAIALVATWLGLTCLWAWLRRPSAEAALAYWDEGASRDEMFMSAYCFESLPKVDPGEQLHLNRAAECLHRSLANLSRDLPVPLVHRAWALPLVFLVLVCGLFLLATPAEEPRMSEPDQARAQEVAETLASQTKLVDKDKGLTPEEEEELEKLEQSVNETAEKLRKLDNETQRDVLAELEERAHEAEELAEAMDAAGEQSLSSEMLEELARHADTTDFASAMQAKDLQKGSEESMKLAERLDHKDLSLEEQKRVEHALDSSLEVATKEDKKGLVGKHLQQAHQDLQKSEPKRRAISSRSCRSSWPGPSRGSWPRNDWSNWPGSCAIPASRSSGATHPRFVDSPRATICSQAYSSWGPSNSTPPVTCPCNNGWGPRRKTSWVAR